MKFGKSENLEHINFDLSFDLEKSLQLLGKADTKSQISIGATSWMNKDWRGFIYPTKIKTNEYLYYYAQNFQTIELNATHYRIPSIEQVINWKNQVGPNFKFCPKIPQSISHSKNLGADRDTLKIFLDAISRLEGNLGPCFLQLPQYFDTSKIDVLNNFLTKWPVGYPLSIEFRHENFYQENDKIRELNERLAEKNIGRVLVDVAGRRDMIAQPTLTDEEVIIRFVGVYPHPGDQKRLHQWLHIIEYWSRQRAIKIHFMIHQSDEKATLYTAHILTEKWNEQKFTPKIRPLAWIERFNPVALFT